MKDDKKCGQYEIPNSNDHRDIQKIANTIRKYGAHASCWAYRVLLHGDLEFTNIKSYRKEMIEAFGRSGASPEEIAEFEDLMGPDDKIVEMGIFAAKFEAEGNGNWWKAFSMHVSGIHSNAVNYATDVLCSRPDGRSLRCD